jgi:hypothetical protein
VATILDTYMTLIKKKITEVESIVNKADNRKTAGKIYLPKDWIGKKVKTILLASLIAMVIIITQQQANAVFPTTQQKEEQDLLKARFYGFILSCKNEEGLSSNHDLTMDEAMKCPRAFNSFKELTGGTDQDVIGLIVDSLRGRSSCAGVALTNEAMRNIIELTGKPLSC